MSHATKENQADLRQSWDNKMLKGRIDLHQNFFELALQNFTAALHMSETNPSLLALKFRVLGEIGWVNRLAGRYAIAVSYLKEALSLADSLPGPRTIERTFIDGELGTVYRLTDRYDDAREAFARQYALATGANKDEDWTRVACRAIGNLGMANYQLALQLLEQNPNGPNIRQKTKDRIKQAISQLEERVRLAEIFWQKAPFVSHGGRMRSDQSLSWKCIGLSRLSLCYTTMAELDPKQKTTWTASALETSKNAVDEGYGNSALPLSRFFYGRALLFSASDPDTKAQALKYLNPFLTSSWWREIVSPAVALCMEPSAEHRGYLRELISAGGDIQTPDPSSGYTALDYAVFSGDSECVAIMLEGLRERLVSAGHSKAAAKKMVHQQRAEARLRRGYREIFQEKFRPELTKQSDRVDYGPDTHEARMKNRALRRETVMNLRGLYSRELAADPETSGMFDYLKVMRYMDFVEFGRLPRSSDGLAAPLEVKGDMGKRKDGEFVIFFSYRWINKDPGLNSPDDTDQTQYKRMLDAVEAYLKTDDSVEKDKLLIWMVSNFTPF